MFLILSVKHFSSHFVVFLNVFYHFFLFSTGDRYVVETDGLLIRYVTPEDAGHYTCRARVLETGSLEERNIKLEVWFISFLSGTK